MKRRIIMMLTSIFLKKYVVTKKVQQVVGLNSWSHSLHPCSDPLHHWHFYYNVQYFINNFNINHLPSTLYILQRKFSKFSEIFYLTVAPPFPGSHLNMFLVKKENPPFFIPDPALPGRTYRPRASPVRVLLCRRVRDRYVLPQLASCGEMAIA